MAKALPDGDATPKALACYGLWLPDLGEMWLRFVDGRPLSAVTIEYLAWCAEQAAVRGRSRLALIWDLPAGIRVGWRIAGSGRTIGGCYVAGRVPGSYRAGCRVAVRG